MKKFLTIITLIFAFSVLSFGQAYKIDDIGPANSEELMLRIGYLKDEISRNLNAKAYIIIERDKKLPFGFPIRFGERLRNYLIEVLQLPENRFEIIDGGIGDGQNISLWIVPAGSQPPLEKSVNKQINLAQAFKFDNFNYPQKEFDGCCFIDAFRNEEKKVSVDEFARLLKENINLDGYLIFYGEYNPEFGVPANSAKTINKILRKEKNNLVKNHNIAPSRIKTINGGYREWQAIELWLVPKGEKPPKPTPETFPRKRVKRMNK